MKHNKLLPVIALLATLLVALTASTQAQAPNIRSEPDRAPRPADSPAAQPLAPRPDWGGSWQDYDNIPLDMPSNRFDGGYYPPDGQVYFMGGRTSGGNNDGSVWSYDPATDIYTDTGADLVTPISHYKMNLLQDATGLGFYTFCGRPDAGGAITATQVYYPDTNTTVQLDPADGFPGESCTRAMNVVYDNQVYVAGGYGIPNQDDTYVFDPLAPVGSKWTHLPSATLNLARADIMGVVVDDKIYAIGGNYGLTIISVRMVEVLDPNAPNPTWNDAAVADLPTECSESRAFGFDSGSPYLDPDGTPLGGKIVSGCGRGSWFNQLPDVYVYDTSLDFWDDFPFLNKDRRSQAGEFVPDTPGVWIWGGVGAEAFSEVYAVLSGTQQCDVLLVDDDWDFDVSAGENDGGRPYYTSTLEFLDVDYDLWDTVSMNIPTAADLAPYEVVIWFTGYDWQTPISPTEEAELIAYLEDGGNLFMSNQDQAFAFPGSTLMSDYFWVDSVVGDVILTGTLGNATDSLYAGLGPYPMGRPDQWAPYWPTGSDQGPYDDQVSVKPGGFEPTVYSDTLTANSTRFEGIGFKTVYLAYPFEWIENLDDRASILDTALDWFCAPPDGRMQLVPPIQAGVGAPGAPVPYTLTLANNLGFTETFSLTYTSVWTSTGPVTVGPVADGTAQDLTVQVDIPTNAGCFDSNRVTVTAIAQSDPTYTDTAYLDTSAEVPGTGSLTGTVYDANTGLGVENAYVYLALQDYYYDTWTNADGSYQLPDVPACTYPHQANALGYDNALTTTTVQAGMTNTLDVELLAPWPVLSDSSVSITVPVGSTDVFILTLDNTGSGDLHFYVSELAQDTIYPMGSGPPRGIDPQVYADLQASPDGTAEFIVYLTEQADLPAAEGIEDWAERGQYVLDSLRATAKRSQASLRAKLDLAGAQYESRYIANALVVEGDLTLAEDILAQPAVAFIEANAAVPAPQPVETSPQLDSPQALVWNIVQVNANDVWSTFGVTGTGIVVSNIDTGALYTHTALVNQYRGNLGGGGFDHNYNWWDPYGDQPNAPYDARNHGSHTIGTMVGDDGSSYQIGMAPGAQWIACNGFDRGGFGHTAELLECAEFLLAPWDLNGANPDPARRPHVINNAWRSVGANWWYNQAIYAWRAAGIVSFFPAGNSGPNCETVGAPDYANTTLVGATDSTDAAAGFSSRGPADVTGLTKPDVSAPGVGVWSAYNDGTIGGMSGTSIAAAHVSGLAALIWSAQPDLIGDVQLTYWLIEQSAMGIEDGQCGDPMPPNNVYGWGRVDAFDAVSLALSSNWTIDWLTVDPTGGVVPALDSAEVALRFDASGLTAGVCYTGGLKAEFNDPYVLETTLPVELCAGEPITTCLEIDGVDLSRVTTGDVYVGDQVDFVADIAPDDATKPYTYTIDYGDGSALVDRISSDDPFDFSYAYAATGTYTVEFTAWNCDQTALIPGTVEVTVRDMVQQSYTIYLPIILRES